MEVLRRRLLPKRSTTSVSGPSWWTRPREPVTSFGYPRHKRLDAPRCGSIQWIRTDCDPHGLETPMVQAPYAVKRANPRFSFFADAEVTLRDGTRAVAQLAELSSRGCYIDTLEPIPIHTKLRLKICDGTSTCE